MTTYSFTLVDVGEGLEDAEIVEWNVGVGDTVEVDQVVVSVETAKSIVELPIPVGGRIASLCGDEGTVVPVGGVLATLETQDAGPEEGTPAPPETPAVAKVSEPLSQPTAHPSPTRIKSSPIVRRLARERGIDLASVLPSGPHGRVTRADLERHASLGAVSQSVQASASPRPREQLASPTVVPFRGTRARIAAVLTESISTVPHIYDWRTADASALLDLKRRLDDSQGKRTSLVTLLARIALAGLRRHPILCADLDEQAGEIRLGGPVHLGLAVAGPDGLVVPVVGDAGARSLSDLNAEVRRLTDLALARSLAPSDQGRATFTLNNLGGLGADHGSPLLRVGEAGAIAFGVVRDGVLAKGGQPVVVPTVGITVVGDHRILDGTELCSFANTVVQLVQEPDLLVAEL